MTSSNGNIFRIAGLCEGNSAVTGGFPSQRPVTGSFDVFFYLRLNKLLSKQPRRRWSETPALTMTSLQSCGKQLGVFCGDSDIGQFYPYPAA